MAVLASEPRDERSSTFSDIKVDPPPPALPASALILIIEHDPLTAHVLDHILRREGYDVLLARGEYEATELCEEYIPDAAVVDMLAPVQSGSDVLHCLRENGRTGSLPILMLGEVIREQDIARATADGATKLLMKPFDPEELVSCLAKMLTTAHD